MVENLETAARSALAALSPMPRPIPGAPPGGGLRLEAVMETLQRQQAARLAQGGIRPPFPLSIPPSLPPQRSHPVGVRAQQSPEEGTLGGTEEGENEEEDEEEEEEEEEEARPQGQPPQPSPGPGLSVSPPIQSSGPQHHEWTYEEQFKQLYELDADPKRKEFLDDLFSFMQKRGTPVNRIPIMAKQVLDLYVLYRLVTEKGGLVEVINRKVWREVTRGLSLPTSITSAAFTLRTQYMKYLYPYECETRALSSPGELQAAIDSNRREGRRQTYGTTPIFSFPAAGPPPPRGTLATTSAAPGLPALACAQLGHSHGHGHAPIKKEEGSGPAPAVAIPRISLPMALGTMREKIGPEEPPEKKAVLMGPMDPPRPTLPPNILPRSKSSVREEPLEVPLNMAGNGISSINMALEINGIVYTGVLFARRPPTLGSSNNNNRNSQGPTSPGPNTPPGPLSSTSP
ncbi:AT-rich interactive domain-containing protein 3C [Antechinus flavipes]|uniref:AT-rich interactive domain-containing protein 3C n=1 Tax=Antechinus flavipes TaxID=38775 RepID=UPI0022354B18|nr:AT-rich interactive domain-containing protein 3C [Antechinus flavipes]